MPLVLGGIREAPVVGMESKGTLEFLRQALQFVAITILKTREIIIDKVNLQFSGKQGVS